MIASKVTEHLWIGARPVPGSEIQFDRLILSASEYQPPASRFVGISESEVHHVPLTDNGEPLSEEQVPKALQAGLFVAAWMKRKKRVVVTCWMGWNRSGLIGAIALMTLGYEVEAAIKKVRAARGENALSNPHFIHLLRNLYEAQEVRVAL